jgi:hypothetical protein
LSNTTELKEETFYIQCFKDESSNIQVHCNELGRIDIRMYGHEKFEQGEFVEDQKMSMESVQFQGYYDQDDHTFVVRAQEFRRKNIFFIGDMPPVKPFEVTENKTHRVKNKSSVITGVSSGSEGGVTLNSDSVKELLNQVGSVSCTTAPNEDNTRNTQETAACDPCLQRNQFNSPEKRGQSRLQSKSLSPESTVFGKVIAT